MEIPKIIHLTHKGLQVPPIFRPFLDRVKKLHPSWDIRVYNDEHARNFMVQEYTSLLKTYDAYSTDIQRKDLFRVAAVYANGGFYMDMDIFCLKPIDSLCSSSIVLGEEKTITTQESLQLSFTHPLMIANYMFGSKQKHPFWRHVLDNIITKSTQPLESEDDVLETTGPYLLTRTYHQLKHVYKEINIIRNKELHCPKKCCKSPSCHFGDFAIHYHMGTWRWKNRIIKSDNYPL